MAIPNAALEKVGCCSPLLPIPLPHPFLTKAVQLIHEIESQAAVAEQQIGVARTQAASKQREMRLLKLTHEEISSIPPSTGVYEGQGKMCVAVPSICYTPWHQNH
jgi:hypothetical protein